MVQPAVPSDAQPLARIGRATFTETFGHLYTPENLQRFLDESHSADWYAGAITDPDIGVWTLKEEGGRMLGYGVAGPNTLPIDGGSRAGEVKRLYILAEAQGRGLGVRLLEVMLGWLADQSYSTQYVGVWSQNHGAQRLYGRYGFEKVGEYIFPVGDHEDLEFILKREA